MNYQLLFFYLREFFFPFGCAVCGKALVDPKDAFFGLCGNCYDFICLHSSEERRCRYCGKPLITENDTCLLCRKNGAMEKGVFNESIVKLKALFPYMGKFHSLLEAFKFKKSIGLGNFFVCCLDKAVQNLNDELIFLEENNDIAWVPVPPRPGKIKKQGWDQIDYLSKLLNRGYWQHKKNWGEASSHMDSGFQCNKRFPVNRCLKRLRSRSQKELNREERKINIKDKIVCVKKPPEIAILFDDVFTTGATMNACAEALLKSGAKKVYGVCLFYD